MAMRSVGIRVLVAQLFVSIASRATANDWPALRGPGGLGVSLEKSLPTKWSATGNIAWKADLPGAGVSSPIVVGDRIFVTCFSGFGMPGQRGGNMSDLVRHVACLDRKSGKLLWTKEVPSKLPEQVGMREDHGYASSTPAADSERVYAFFGVSGVFAFDHAGKQLWHADVGQRLNPNKWGSAAALGLYGDLVLVNASSESDSLIALNKKTGKEVWRTPGIRESWHMPVAASVDGKVEIIIAILGKVFGVDPSNGEKLWSCNTDIGWYMVPCPVVDGGIVFCLGGRDGTVGMAVRAGGRGDVTRTHRLWTSKKGSNVTSPVFHDGHLYWMNDQRGVAYCAEAKSGRVVYEERIPGASQTYASPILADGKIYYTDRSGKTFIVAARPSFELLGQNSLGNRLMVNASPTVADGRLLMRVDRHLYCIGEAR